MSSYSVLIADDHQLFIDGVKMLLNATDQFEVVAEASNGKRVLAELERITVELAILDINMPELDGVETAKMIKKQYPTIRILILTMYSHPSFVKRLIRAGVDGYILKENSQKELMTALQTVAVGKKYFASEVTEAVMNSFNPEAELKGADQVKLTRREREVLQLVLKEKTTQEIADQLFVSQNTVITHRKNIMRKLDVRNVAGMVRVATELGLVD